MRPTTVQVIFYQTVPGSLLEKLEGVSPQVSYQKLRSLQSAALERNTVSDSSVPFPISGGSI